MSNLTKSQYLEMYSDIRLMELNNERLDSAKEYLSPFRRDILIRIQKDNQYRLDKIKRQVASIIEILE